MSDDNQTQDEHEELNEQELDAISGGFDPQPDPPGIERIRPPDLPQIMIRKVSGEQH
jgi:bacteriocin-like protein